MDEAGLRYWEGAQQRCPGCGGIGIPVVLEVTDAETMEALRTGLVCLGECCYDGATGADRECRDCGRRWSSGDPQRSVIPKG